MTKEVCLWQKLIVNLIEARLILFTLELSLLVFKIMAGENITIKPKRENPFFILEIVDTRSLRENFNDPGLDKSFSYTRSPDIKVGELTTKAYVNNNPWEFPQGVKEYRYFVEKDNFTYMIGGYIEGKNFPVYYISEQEFDQILSTFKFLD